MVPETFPAPSCARDIPQRLGGLSVAPVQAGPFRVPAKFVIGAVVAVAVGGTGVNVGVDVGGALVAVGVTGVAVAPGIAVLVGALVAVGACGVVPATVADGDAVVALGEALALANGLADGRAVGEPVVGDAAAEPPGLAALEGAGDAELAGLPESSPP